MVYFILLKLIIVLGKKMIPSTSSNKNSKEIIYGMVSTLTELDPNIIEIRQPIEASNLLVKEITQNIEQLKKSNKLIKLGHLAVLENNLPSLKTQLDQSIQQIKSGKVDAEKLINDFNVVITTLNNVTKSLDENDPLKTDALSIVSLNNIKVKNIQNQIQNADHQIEMLERFSSITLYHLSETINSNKKDKDLPVVNEIQRVQNQIQNTLKKLSWCALALTVLSVYNFLASNYHIQYESVEKIAKPSTDTTLEVIPHIETILSIINGLSSFLMVMSLIAVVWGLFNSTRKGGTGERSSITFGLAVAVFAFFISFAFEAMLGSPKSVQYVEKASLVTIDFLNFGLIGTVVIFAILLGCVILGVKKFQESKQYKSLIEKLSSSKLEHTNTDHNQPTVAQEG